MNNEQKKLATEHLRDLRKLAVTNYVATDTLCAFSIILCILQVLSGGGVCVLAFQLPNNTIWQLVALLIGMALIAFGILMPLYLLPNVVRAMPVSAEQLQLDIYRYGLEEVSQEEEASEEVKVS